MKSFRIALIAVCVSCLTLSGLAQAKSVAPAKPLVQIAVLLDTSNSMDGLIAQAKTQLWKIVNEFISAKKAGQRPEIQVALLEYGKDSLPSSDGYIRVIQPLTTDLDKVSEELFALKTNGGQEYCGQVIQVATQKLEWSKNPGDLKVMVIAGNEAFTQGPVDYKVAAKAAIAKGIMINTIFCGNLQEGINTNWKDGATLADGHYLNIDQNRQVPQIAAPQDDEIARLGSEMNKTYIGYGSRGKASKMRQEAQDRNAASAAPAAMAERAKFKSSGAYSAADWDLADAVKEKKVDLKSMDAEALPEEMRGMDAKEQEEYVNKQTAKRAEIQKKIQELSAERQKYVAEKQKELAKGGADTLDAAMIKSIRAQAVKKNFKFE
jgi:hypothetical protein